MRGMRGMWVSVFYHYSCYTVESHLVYTASSGQSHHRRGVHVVEAILHREKMMALTTCFCRSCLKGSSLFYVRFPARFRSLGPS